MDEYNVLVLYGSQTGNAESIAKDLNAAFQEMEYTKSTCIPLNEATDPMLVNSAIATIIICSTTGNGDAPENADKFWRKFKNRSVAKDTFIGAKYAVLGLGDTNYDKFCYMGKSIDKKLSELGGVRFLDLHCADESTNLEQIVESFKTKVITVAKDIINEQQKLQENTMAISDNHEILNELSIDDNSHQNCTTNGELKVHSNSPLPHGIATMEQALHHVRASLSVSSGGDMGDVNFHIPPDTSMLPKFRKTNNEDYAFEIDSSTATATAMAPLGGAETSLTSNSMLQMLGCHETDGTKWNVSNPYHARVVAASYITKPITSLDKKEEKDWDNERRVILLELDITASGIHYTPGDAVAICAPNPQLLVSSVIERLQKHILLHPESYGGGKVVGRDTPVKAPNGTHLSLGELLSYRVDLVSIPKKATVLTLSLYCNDPKELAMMQWLCAKGHVGNALWSKFIESQCIGVGELLCLFPSCCPSLSELLSILPPLAPRAYSICSSQLVHPHSVLVAFSVVQFSCGLDVGSHHSHTHNSSDQFVIRRNGLCTSYLEHMLIASDCLSTTHSHPPPHTNSTSLPQFRIIFKPSISFHLPSSISHPLIMIGPGTGVAPFIGFLEQREALGVLRRKCSENTSTGLWRGCFEVDDLGGEGDPVDSFMSAVNPGQTWLFFGCRNHHDFLFENQMNKFRENGTLTELEVAFSRVEPEKVYVSHKLKERGQKLANLILHQNAYLYICGDGNSMAKDVTKALLDILMQHGSLSSLDATNTLDEMKLRRRFVLDIWS